MPVSEKKRAEQSAFDAKVDILRRRMTQRQVAVKLKCSPTKVRAAIGRLGEISAMDHQPEGNHVVVGGIVHICTCGWRSRPWFSNMLASAAGEAHREGMERLRIANSAVKMHWPIVKDGGSHDRPK